MLSRHFEDDQWKLLQQVGPTKNQKEAVKARILESIQTSPARVSRFQWKSLVAACLLIFICGSFLFFTLQESTPSSSTGEMAIDETRFSWELDDVYGKKSGDGLDLYRQDQTVTVGVAEQVASEEMKKIITSSAMFVDQNLENFPYPTHMYIEHVKMMDLALRYHFFIPQTDQVFIHFSFDYPKLEYAEIFHAMATLQLKGIKPYKHYEQLYVTHGYGNLIFPVGLEPISIFSNKEVYHWENASAKTFTAYLEKIVSGGWRTLSTKDESHTFESADGNQVVTITVEGKTITYEFFYPNQEE